MSFRFSRSKSCLKYNVHNHCTLSLPSPQMDLELLAIVLLFRFKKKKKEIGQWEMKSVAQLNENYPCITVGKARTIYA